jgi:hypothetical protein
MKPAILAIITVVVLAVGVAGGLIYTWVLAPVEYYDTAPDALHIQGKASYSALIGDLYACDGDLERAKVRLAVLGLNADGPTLITLLEQYLEGGGKPEEARNLAQLAKDLGASGGVLLVFGSVDGGTPEADASLTPEVTGANLPVVSPTPAPTMTPVPSFLLLEQTALCGAAGEPGQISIWVQDESGAGLPGMQLVVSWSMGEDRLYTGLRPKKGKGFADFEMKPQVNYDVTLADYHAGVAEGLRSEFDAGICPTDTIALDWRLIFQRVQ